MIVECRFWPNGAVVQPPYRDGRPGVSSCGMGNGVSGGRGRGEAVAERGESGARKEAWDLVMLRRAGEGGPMAQLSRSAAATRKIKGSMRHSLRSLSA